MREKNPKWMDLRDFNVARRVEAKQPKIVPKTPGQARYVEAIKSHQVTICVGSPGTGKSILSVAIATEELRAGKIDKIVLTRPLVECLRPGTRAESRLGFLPGGIQEKMAPFVAAIRGCFLKVMSPEELAKYEASEVVQYIPVEVMRGLTFDRSFVIADESQNLGRNQLRMLLTRFAETSKVVVNGDLFQSDIVEDDEDCPLLFVMKQLYKLDGVAIVQLGDEDIVRSKLVREIEKRLR